VRVQILQTSPLPKSPSCKTTHRRMKAHLPRKMDMHSASLTVAGKLEVMMLQVREAMAHVVFTGRNLFLPNGRTSTFNPDFSVTSRKSLPMMSSGPRLHVRSFDAGEIEIISPFEFVIRELIPRRHSDAVRNAVLINQVDACHLSFFAAILSMPGISKA